jgi:hypothetical protein
MHYYLYKITNILNNNFYIGVHKTNNIDDGYFGSGLNINRAIKKHGKKNFKKEILKFFDNETDMFLAEAEIVTEDFLKQPNVYNVQIGGHGGFTKSMSIKGAKATVERKLGVHGQTKEQLSNAGKKGTSSQKLNKIGVYNPANKEKLQSYLAKACQAAKKTNKESIFAYHYAVGLKRIKKDLLPYYIEQGWMYMPVRSKTWKSIKNLSMKIAEGTHQ